MTHRTAVARVLGTALIDKAFAEQLANDPVKAANSIGLHLGPNEVAALKDVNVGQLDNVAGVIRNKLGIAAVLDQQQQQARMD
jgi:hypothetical protein